MNRLGDGYLGSGTLGYPGLLAPALSADAGILLPTVVAVKNVEISIDLAVATAQAKVPTAEIPYITPPVATATGAGVTATLYYDERVTVEKAQVSATLLTPFISATTPHTIIPVDFMNSCVVELLEHEVDVVVSTPVTVTSPVMTATSAALLEPYIHLSVMLAVAEASMEPSASRGQIRMFGDCTMTIVDTVEGETLISFNVSSTMSIRRVNMGNRMVSL